MHLRRVLPYIVLLAWTAVLYFPSVANPFVYDDQPQIAQNPHLINPTASLIYLREPAVFDDAFGAQSGSFYRPLFWLSLVADKEIGGGNPEFLHATNLLIHALNGILVFLLFRRFFSGLVPLAAALAWLSLPIHTEVVAWISGRGLSLTTLFILLAMLAAAKYGERRRLKYLALSALACSAALLSHEAGIVAPFLSTLMAVWTAAAPDRRRATLYVFVAGAIPLAAYAILRVVVFRGVPASLQALPVILLQGPVTVAKYIWWTIRAPAMSMERSTELIELTFNSWIYVAAWLTIISATGAAIWLRHRVPLLAVGFATAAIALLPFAQILKLYQSVAERYVYTASIGIVLALVGILTAVQVKWRLPVWSPAAVLLLWIALSVLPLQERVRAWSSEESLYTTSLKETPRSALLHQNLGVLYAKSGDVASASTFFKAAILLKPSYLQAHLNLANLYMRSGQLNDAISEFNQVLQYDPENVGAQLNLSNLMAEQGDLDSALRLFTHVAQGHPDSYEAELGLGIVLHRKGDLSARKHLEKALEIKPDSAATAFNLAMIEEESGHLDAARQLYEQVLRYHPGDLDAMQHLRGLAPRPE